MSLKMNLFKILVLLGMMLLVFNSQAQYKENRDRFNLQEYKFRKGDPYNPTVCGIASYFMPGLGQMIAGEYGRGMAFSGGYTASIISIVAGMAMFSNYGHNKYDNQFATSFLVTGMVSNLGVTIWSIVDAVKCAKVNNLVYREQTGKVFNFKFKPYYEQINLNSRANLVGLNVSISW